MPATRERDERFEVRREYLVRNVVPTRGKPYVHRCPLVSYEELAQAADEIGDAGFTVEELAGHAKLPMTQAAVALAFWKERGCVTTEHRRSYPACTFLFEDAMLEFYALGQQG